MCENGKLRLDFLEPEASFFCQDTIRESNVGRRSAVSMQSGVPSTQRPVRVLLALMAPPILRPSASRPIAGQLRHDPCMSSTM
eukprot:scaffold124854_cov72-Phaeocystis_antarctica.AAC.2